MLSNQFKKTIKDALKTHYDIDCHRSSMYPHQEPAHQDFTIHCSAHDKSFTLRMIVRLCKGFVDSSRYSFYVFAEERYVDCSKKIYDRMSSSLIRDSIKEVRGLFSYLNPYYSLKFGHTNISMLSGVYTDAGGLFEVRSIDVKIETTSFIDFENSIEPGQVCCNINILGNKIVARPAKGYATYPIFQAASTLEENGMDIFKANLAKSFLIYLKNRYGNIPEFDTDESHFIDFDYEAMKQYLLLLQIQYI